MVLIGPLHCLFFMWIAVDVKTVIHPNQINLFETHEVRQLHGDIGNGTPLKDWRIRVRRKPLHVTCNDVIVRRTPYPLFQTCPEGQKGMAIQVFKVIKGLLNNQSVYSDVIVDSELSDIRMHMDFIQAKTCDAPQLG